MAIWSAQFESVLRMHGRLESATANIDPDVSLVQLGVDSLGSAELIALIEDEFGVEIPLERLTPDSFATLRAVWELLCSIDPTLVEANPAG
ncbi:phosphopantetheine-binding protein [Dactylosporangium sp. NPDC051485]|uniref:phosphopantetheine-binding protein n=1 Tax=Dactylosporangium sp. NPDC051485 TaxID=3154846 RepID=UPI003425AA21